MSGLLRPPEPGRTASPGSRTSLNTSSLVSDARSECLPCIPFASKPPFPFDQESADVLVGTGPQTATSAIEPFVIHIFEPFRTQPSPTFWARVFMPLGSDPWSASVSPKQPIASAFAIAGSQRRFCSSEPNAKIGYMTSALHRDEGAHAAVPARAPA